MMPILPLLCAGLGLCASLNDTQQRTLTGAGAAGGYLFDKHKKFEQRSHAEDHMADQSSKHR